MTNVFQKLKKNYIILFIDIVMVVILIFGSQYFLSASNFDSLQTSIAPVGIIAVGMMVLLISGHFDLSVGANMNLSALVTTLVLGSGGNFLVAILAGLAVGAAIGMANGLLVSLAKVNPLITTIGMMNIVKGIADLLNADKGLYSAVVEFPDNFVAFGNGMFGGIYIIFWVMLGLTIFMALFMQRSATGRNLYYIGGNMEAAKQMGIKTERTVIGAYLFTGFLSALAGIMLTARLQMATRFLGEDMHMTVLISCIIGGGSMAGGKGRIVGAVLGAVFSSLLTNAFNLFEVNTTWQKIVLGMVLVVVVLVDGMTVMREQRRLGKI